MKGSSSLPIHYLPIQPKVSSFVPQTGGMSTGFDSSAMPSVRLSSNVMVGILSAIFSIIIVIFFIILYLYAKHVWAPSHARRLRRSRLVFAASDPVSFPRCGLGSAVLEALPVTIFHDSEEELECAVCLCELSDGEQVRLLPKCNHGFHLECIDMWFQSHSNCPLCRNPVEINTTPERVPATETAFSLTESSAGFFPANMYVGEDRVISAPVEPASSSVKNSVKREGMLVIEIPRLPMEFPLPSTPFPTSETMKTPISSSRRTLTRLLSRGKRTVEYFSASPGDDSGDTELGLRGAAGENWRGINPRIPKNS